MDSLLFNSIVENQADKSMHLLTSKNDHYNPGEDRLHNFKVAAALKGTTMRGALAGMMSKHTVSVYDMCNQDGPSPMEVWDEKITDHINYLLLLRAVVEQEARDRGERYVTPRLEGEEQDYYGAQHSIEGPAM